MPPARRTAAAALLAATLPSPAAVAQVLPLALGDASFEHDTQAASGQTTGKWAVLFVPKDSMFTIEWEDALGWELGQVEGVISAVVRCDDTAAKKTCRRFGVTRSSHAPRVVLLADRGLYEPDGPAHALASRDALVSWATEGYRATKRREVPPEPSAFEEALAWFWSALGLSRDGGGDGDDEL